MTEATIPTPAVRATTYEVSCLPPDNINAFSYTIRVEWRVEGRWAVLRNGHQSLSVDGAWDYEHIPSERRDEWLETHRFDLDTALQLAQEQAPLLRCNGYTVADALKL